MSGVVVPIEVLDKESKGIEEQERRIQGLIRDLELDLRSLHARRELLQSLRKQAVGTVVQDPRATEVASDSSAAAQPELEPVQRYLPGVGPSMNDLIVECVAQHPDGLLPREIVDRVVKMKESKSADARNMLFNYVASLQKRGFLKKNAVGRVVIGPKPWKPTATA